MRTATVATPPVVAQADVFIGLGANLGDAQTTVVQAIERIAALPQTRLLCQSSLYRTAPIDAGGDDYVNAVIEIATSLTPLELLHKLQRLEQLAGRLRPYRNAPRTLDLDILLYGDQHITTPELTVPHPRMAARAFVLQPLAEIAPQRVSPQALQAVSAQVLARLSPQDG